MVHFSETDRGSALIKIEAFVEGPLAEEAHAAFETFYSAFSADNIDSLGPDWEEMSEAVYDMWLFFDHHLEDGRCVADLLLERDSTVTAREREYLQTLKGTSVRLYDVEDLVPGVSISLRDIIGGSRITVSERTASRTLTRRSCLAGRKPTAALVGSRAPGAAGGQLRRSVPRTGSADPTVVDIYR